MNFLKNKSLAFKLSIYLLSLISLTFGILFTVNYLFTEKIIQEDTHENAKYIAFYNTYKIKSVLKSVEMIPENIANLIEKGGLDNEKLEDFLSTVVNFNDEIFGGTIAFEPGVLIGKDELRSPYFFKENNEIKYADLGTPEYQYPYKDWYQIPKLIDKPVWSEPYFDEGGGNILMSTYSVPFYIKKNGERIFAGIVTADISLEWLDEIVSGVKIFDSGFAYIITRNGAILNHPIKEFVMNESIFSLAEEYNKPELREVGLKMLKGESNYIDIESVALKKLSHMFFTPIPETGWTFIVVIPEDELFASLNELNKIILLIGLAGFVSLLMLIFYVTNRSVKPLHQLAEATKAIAAGNFDLELPAVKSNDEVGKLTYSMRRMQEELKNYIENLKETTAAKQLIESELQIARQIQEGMIPKLFPPFPDRKELDIYASLEPAKDVGGDLYDFFFIDDRYLCLAIGDVAGKGVPASLLMAVTRTLLRSYEKEDVSVKAVINKMNKDLKENYVTKMFVTFWIAIFDLKTGKLKFSNAGHNYPYIIKKNGEVIEMDVRHGMPLGVVLMKNYESAAIYLEPGDKLVLYTDGVNEAMNENGDMYGYENLVDVLKNNYSNSAEDLTRKIKNSIKKFTGEAEQSDDITIVVLDFMNKMI